jgi:hypothetical protein
LSTVVLFFSSHYWECFNQNVHLNEVFLKGNYLIVSFKSVVTPVGLELKISCLSSAKRGGDWRLALKNEFVIDVFLICVFLFSFPRYLAMFIISGWEFSVARRVGFYHPLQSQLST